MGALVPNTFKPVLPLMMLLKPARICLPPWVRCSSEYFETAYSIAAACNSFSGQPLVSGSSGCDFSHFSRLGVLGRSLTSSVSTATATLGVKFLQSAVYFSATPSCFISETRWPLTLISGLGFPSPENENVTRPNGVSSSLPGGGRGSMPRAR